MNTASPLICSTCNGPISNEDLAQGLAVRVDGQTICPMCVDLLPGRAQFEINKLRALKGFSATTYRVLVPAHADHLRFTFTTASNIMGHYRTIRADGAFVAPWLPEQTSVIRPKTPKPTSRTHSSSTNGVKVPSRSHLAPTAAPARSASRQWLFITVGAVLLLVLCGVTIALLVSPSHHPAPSPATGHTALASVRSDYPADPFAAWLMCTTDPRCPQDLVIAIDQELRTHLQGSLDQTAVQLQAHAYAAAATLLGAVRIPDDPSFNALRGRAHDLQAQLTQASAAAQVPTPAPAPAPPEAVLVPQEAMTSPPAETPQPPGSVSDGAAVTGPVIATDATPAPKPAQTPAPAPIPSAPPPALPAPSGESWMIPTRDLLPQGSPALSSTGILVMGSELQRTLPPLSGGSYQIWAQGGNLHDPQGSLMLMVDGQLVQTLSGAAASAIDWHVLTPDIGLAPGPHLLQIEVVGGGWQLGGFYLATTSYPEPGRGPPYTKPPWPSAAVATPPPPVHGSDQIAIPAPVLSGQRHVAVWTPSFVWPATLRPEPMDGTSNIPSPWPAGSPPFYRAQLFTPNGPDTLVLHLLRKDVQGGGVVLILNPMRVDRKRVRVSLEWTEDSPTGEMGSSHGNILTMEPLIFSAQAWQVFAITLPDVSKLPRHLRLRLDDTTEVAPDDSRGFLLGSVITVANGKPDATDLGPLSAPFQGGDIISDPDYQRKMIEILGRVGAHRHGGHPWTDIHFFNPLAVQILVAQATPDWMSQMKRRLLQIGPLSVPRSGLIKTMGLDPDWFQNHEFGHGRPVLDPDEISLGVIMLNGQEAMTSLHDPDELSNYVRRVARGLIDGDQGRFGGILPVFVIGMTTNNPMAGQQSQISNAWSSAVLSCKDLGIPVIDISNAQFSQADTPEQASVRLLGDGLATLCYQLQWAQRKLQP